VARRRDTPLPGLAGPGPPLGCSETEWQRWIVVEARARGWAAWHFQPARVGGGRNGGPVRWMTPGNRPGFPDLVLLRPPRLVFLECKRQKGWEWKRGQRETLLALQACSGVEAWMVQPRDWPDVIDLLDATEPLALDALTSGVGEGEEPP
jgi:hypothetical protein